MKLDDIISTVWLGSVTLAFISTVGVGAYLVVTGDITVTGSINVGAVVSTVVAPIIVMMTLLAMLDVYGKRRVKTAIDILKSHGVVDEDDE